ncbi:HAMP domain-containing sensor histidine kinase (plasmid) [Aminobacter sp. NyZ550]|uniref:sensor histidine kinase n=1 Tax=unclassified Aminobacter TaxID=2644704 RepID=UPI0021D57824|nr:HAMP domain-containing sensor histidine kinase [Aminobacter sp. NyZ550]WAX98682.1 HAMP domain-containing sensor histidine kinase [Aminobacter sp. NyZ550]
MGPLLVATIIYTIFLVAMQPLFDVGRVPVINPTPMLFGVGLIMTRGWHRLWVFPFVAMATFISVWWADGEIDPVTVVGTSFSRAGGILLFVIFLEMLLPSGVDVRRVWHVLAIAVAMLASLLARSYLLPYLVPESVTTGPSVAVRFIDAFVPNTRNAIWTSSIAQAAGLLGMVALAPPVLLLLKSPWRWPSLREGVISVLAGGMVFSLVWFIFNRSDGSLLFLITVAMIVVTFSSGFLSASLGVLGIGMTALAIQLNNLRLGIVSVLDIETLTVQCFLAATTLVTLLVGAALETRKLFQMQSELDRRAAENANAVKSRFLATMSHEIRSPLASLALLTSGLLKTTSARDERVESLRIIDNISNHVLNLLNGVLNYTRFEAEGHTLHRSLTNVSILVRNVAATLLAQAQEKGIELEIGHSDPTLELQLDPERVSQVLINLVSNGLQHAKARVSIAFALVGNTHDRLRVTVADDGSGIPDASLEHIFEPYYRAEGHSRTGRMGLGLAISSEIVSLMGGTIGVERGPGQNTVFWFEVPSTTFPESDRELEDTDPTATDSKAP